MCSRCALPCCVNSVDAVYFYQRSLSWVICCCFVFHHPPLLSSVFIHNCCNTVIAHTGTQYTRLPPQNGKPVKVVCRKENERARRRKEEEERREERKEERGRERESGFGCFVDADVGERDVEPERLEPVSHKRNEVSLIIWADYFVLRQIYLILHAPHCRVLSGVAFKYKCL